jgi:GT2 family glycosyltransferase
MRYYPEIPTGVGFCMYIKKEIINTIGYFDEVNFSSGYGEENDFCWRASQRGYVHILDDATFIFHRGGGSFTEKVKNSKEESALNTMQRLHPDYNQKVQQFIRDNPLKSIQEYISMRIDLYDKKISMLTMDN